MTPEQDTKGKPVPADATRLHHKLATDQMVDTGAGKGPMGGKNPPKFQW